MSYIERFSARLIHVLATDDSETILAGAEGITWDRSVYGVACHLEASVPNHNRQYSTGGPLEGLLGAGPQKAWLRLDLFDLQTDPFEANGITVAKVRLQRPLPTDSGNPVYQVSGSGILNDLNVEDQELAPLGSPLASEMIQAVFDLMAVEVDMTAWTGDFQIMGPVDFGKFNPLTWLRGLLIEERGAEILEDFASDKIIIRDHLTFPDTPAISVVRGTGTLIRCDPRRGEIKPITSQVVTAQVFATAVAAATLDPGGAWGLVGTYFRRTEDSAIREVLDDDGRLAYRDEVRFTPGDDGIRGISERITLRQSFTADSLLKHSLEKTWTLVSGVRRVSRKVDLEWRYDAANYPSLQYIRTWGLSGSLLQATDRQRTKFTWSLELLRTKQIPGTAIVTKWERADALLRLSSRTKEPQTRVPDTDGVKASLNKIKGGWEVTDPDVLEAWKPNPGKTYESKWCQTVADCDALGRRKVLLSLYERATPGAVDCDTPYDLAATLGCTALVDDPHVEYFANVYLGQYSASYEPGKLIMKISKALPGVA